MSEVYAEQGGDVVAVLKMLICLQTLKEKLADPELLTNVNQKIRCASKSLKTLERVYGKMYCVNVFSKLTGRLELTEEDWANLNTND